MLERYECIFLTMYEKGWTLHFVHDVNISEAVIYDVLKKIACLFSDDVSDRHERTHQ